MLKTNNNEAFLFATSPLPPFSVLNFIAARTAHLNSKEFIFWLLSQDHHFWHFLAQSLPYLVLCGVRLTVLGHSLEKYESSEKLCGRPPTAKITTLLIAYRQLLPKKSKTLKIQLSSPDTLKNSKRSNIQKILLRQTLELLYLGKQPIIQKTSNILTFGKKYHGCDTYQL